MTEARPTAVALVGLGVIGQVHRAVIERHPGLELVAVADPTAASAATREKGPHSFATLADLLDAMERGVLPVDLVVLATPTPLHTAHVAQVLERTAAQVLCEKPLATDLASLDGLAQDHADLSRRLRVVNHFAFSPEVDWAAGVAAQGDWGPSTHAVSCFNDPYATKSAEQRATYVSSCVDSLPNQLAVLARFGAPVDADAVTSHEQADDGCYAETVFSREGTTAVLTSNWHTGDSSKHTVLRWGQGSEERELLLDHTAMTALALAGGRPVAHFAYAGGLSRKAAHYTSMYDALLSGAAPEAFGLVSARATAEVLAHAGAQSPRW